MSRAEIEKNDDDETEIHLPPEICTNSHPKAETVHIAVDEIKPKEHITKSNRHQPLVYFKAKPPPEPMSAHPLIVCCSPRSLYFELNEEPVVAKVGIINCCTRPIYVQCCGLWGDETSRLGASWSAYPRKRYWLSPGLRMDLYVKATPRPVQPIRSASSSLQFDATHLRDSVTGYFMVPIRTTFLKYTAPLPVVSEYEVSNY